MLGIRRESGALLLRGLLLGLLGGTGEGIEYILAGRIGFGRLARSWDWFGRSAGENGGRWFRVVRRLAESIRFDFLLLRFLLLRLFHHWLHHLALEQLRILLLECVDEVRVGQLDWLVLSPLRFETARDAEHNLPVFLRERDAAAVDFKLALHPIITNHTSPTPATSPKLHYNKRTPPVLSLRNKAYRSQMRLGKVRPRKLSYK